MNEWMNDERRRILIEWFGLFASYPSLCICLSSLLVVIVVFNHWWGEGEKRKREREVFASTCCCCCCFCHLINLFNIFLYYIAFFPLCVFFSVFIFLIRILIFHFIRVEFILCNWKNGWFIDWLIDRYNILVLILMTWLELRSI